MRQVIWERAQIKGFRGTLIMENYKNIHNGYGNGVWWDESYENHLLSTPRCKSPSHNSTTQECQRSNIFYTVTWEEHYLTVHFYLSIALLEPNDKNQKLKLSFSVIKQQALWFNWSSRFIQTGQSESNYALFRCSHFNLLKQKDFPSATWLNSTR